MPEGTVSRFFFDKGFGFISPDDGSEDVFVHRKNTAVPGFTCDNPDMYLEKGQRVEYEVVWDDKHRKWAASKCSGFKEAKGGGKGEGHGCSTCRDLGKDINQIMSHTDDQCRIAQEIKKKGKGGTAGGKSSTAGKGDSGWGNDSWGGDSWGGDSWGGDTWSGESWSGDSGGSWDSGASMGGGMGGMGTGGESWSGDSGGSWDSGASMGGGMGGMGMGGLPSPMAAGLIGQMPSMGMGQGKGAMGGGMGSMAGMGGGKFGKGGMKGFNPY